MWCVRECAAWTLREPFQGLFGLRLPETSIHLLRVYQVPYVSLHSRTSSIAQLSSQSDTMQSKSDATLDRHHFCNHQSRTTKPIRRSFVMHLNTTKYQGICLSVCVFAIKSQSSKTSTPTTPKPIPKLEAKALESRKTKTLPPRRLCCVV